MTLPHCTPKDCPTWYDACNCDKGETCPNCGKPYLWAKDFARYKECMSCGHTEAINVSR